MDIIVVNMIKKAPCTRKHAGVAFNIAIVYLELEGHFLAANQQNSNRHSVTNLFLNYIIALFIWSPGQGKAPPIAISSTDTRKTPYYSPRKNRFTPKINTITEFFKKFRRSLGVTCEINKINLEKKPRQNETSPKNKPINFLQKRGASKFFLVGSLF